MKPLFSLLLTAALTGTAHAQIQVGSAELPTMGRAGKLTEDDLARFKGTTTLFTLQDRDYSQAADFEKAIAASWKFTPFKVIRASEIGQYRRERNKYSFATFGGFVVQHQSRGIGGGSVSTHLSYDLWMPHYKKNGEVSGQDLYARIMLSPDDVTLRRSGSGLSPFGSNKEWSASLAQRLYTSSSFSNWNAGFLQGYLAAVSRHLAADEERGVFSELSNDNALAGLQRDTLFIPLYVNNKYNALSGTEQEAEEGDEADIRKAYPYPVKYLDADALSARILAGGKPIYYLTYVRSSTDKYVNVYRSTGDLLYAQYTPISFNFKNKDLSRLAKRVR